MIVIYSELPRRLGMELLDLGWRAEASFIHPRGATACGDGSAELRDDNRFLRCVPPSTPKAQKVITY